MVINTLKHLTQEGIHFKEFIELTYLHVGWWGTFGLLLLLIWLLLVGSTGPPHTWSTCGHRRFPAGGTRSSGRYFSAGDVQALLWLCSACAHAGCLGGNFGLVVSYRVAILGRRRAGRPTALLRLCARCVLVCGLVGRKSRTWCRYSSAGDVQALLWLCSACAHAGCLCGACGWLLGCRWRLDPQRDDGPRGGRRSDLFSGHCSAVPHSIDGK